MTVYVSRHARLPNREHLPLSYAVLGCALQFIREKYWEYEYEEVVTPNLFNFDLWTRSGHADHYRDNMFHPGCGGPGVWPQTHELPWCAALPGHPNLPPRVCLASKA